MKPGDTAEFSIWLSGEETEAQLHHFKDTIIPSVISKTEKQFKVVLGPPRFIIKKPGEDRVPPVPDHIKGIDVRLLVIEADVFPAPLSVIEKRSGFIDDLTKQDRDRLRKLTKKTFAKYQPGNQLNDQQADAIIEFLGPDSAIATLRSH